jgi:hypothetical protein
MDATPGREFVERACAAAGVPVKVAVTTPAMLAMAGLFMPMAREVRVVMYQWTAPWVSDWSAFEAAFGPFARTPLDDALAATMIWWRGHVAEAAAAKAA